MSRKEIPGSTDVFEYFKVPAGTTITDLDLQYVRSGGTPSVMVAATAGTVGVHGDNQAVYVDAADSPELLQVCFPDAAYAVGVKEVILTVFNPVDSWERELRVSLIQDLDIYEGAIWFDDTSGNINTVLGVDGTPSNPVSSLSALQTLLTSSGFGKAKVKGQLLASSSLAGNEIDAWDGSADVVGSASADFSDCILKNLLIRGSFTSNDSTVWKNCLIQSVGGGGIAGRMYDCNLQGNINLLSGGLSLLQRCSGPNNLSLPLVFDFQNADHDITLKGFQGVASVTANTNAGSVLELYADGPAEFTMTGSDGSSKFVGIGKLTDSTGGTHTLDQTNWVNVDSLATELALISAIKAKTDQLDFNGGGFVKSALTNVETSGVDVITQNLGKFFNAIKIGTLSGGGHTVSLINTDMSFPNADSVIGSLLVFQHNSGSLAYTSRVITTHTTGGQIEFTPPLPVIPPNGDQVFIVPAAYNIGGATLTNQLAIKAKTDNLPADPASETTLATIIANIAALNDISVADVLTQINAALDAANSAQASPPNVDTGSLREFIQMCAVVLKGKKIQTASNQEVRTQGDGGTYGTRTITEPVPGQLEIGELT